MLCLSLQRCRRRIARRGSQQCGQGVSPKFRSSLKHRSEFLDNSMIAELLARESEKARPPLQKALRRAARRAFLWPEEASDIVRRNRSLTELSGVGPTLEKYILRWLDVPPPLPPAPEIREGFLT